MSLISYYASIREPENQRFSDVLGGTERGQWHEMG